MTDWQDQLNYSIIETSTDEPYIECFTTGRCHNEFIFSMPYSRDLWAGLKQASSLHSWIVFATDIWAKCWINDKQYWLVDKECKMKSIGEYRSIVSTAYLKICDMIKEDNGSNPERSRRLEKARVYLDGTLDGIDTTLERD